jgi:hypothetical protein
VFSHWTPRVVVRLDVVRPCSELRPPTGLLFIPQLIHEPGGMILTGEN